MFMLKKTVFLFLIVVVLNGCTTSNHTLNITPTMVLPQPDPSLMGVTISINGADQRPAAELAKVNRDGKLIALIPSRDLRFLLQEVFEKQMAARGYMIGPDGMVNLQIVVNNLYANVQEGDLRHNITTKADISVIAQAKNGSQFAKNYRATYNVQGLFAATNSKISNAVNTVLSDVISEMAQDISISSFIKKNAR